MAVGSHEYIRWRMAAAEARTDSGGSLAGGHRPEKAQGSQGAPGASR